MAKESERDRHLAGEVHESVGLPHDAEVNGEKIVYEYDENGKFVGWHKEAKNG